MMIMTDSLPSAPVSPAQASIFSPFIPGPTDKNSSGIPGTIIPPGSRGTSPSPSSRMAISWTPPKPVPSSMGEERMRSWWGAKRSADPGYSTFSGLGFREASLSARSIGSHWVFASWNLSKPLLPEAWRLETSRRFFSYYCEPMSFAHHIKHKVMNSPTLSQMGATLAEYFDQVPGDRLVPLETIERPIH